MKYNRVCLYKAFFTPQHRSTEHNDYSQRGNAHQERHHRRRIHINCIYVYQNRRAYEVIHAMRNENVKYETFYCRCLVKTNITPTKNNGKQQEETKCKQQQQQQRRTDRKKN